MAKRTFETQDRKGDAALIDPGPTHNRTNDQYNDACRKTLDFDPGSMRNGVPDNE